ncbi:hypothetical protein KIH39_13005 [Telmatocola sphagniphila]|uniref:Carboxypeptidase regulatory-like domain-containing protein n=1 Tax=Telmatocola sphagniphila TaxID=1123043 RepID=A0A8E6BB43_9BACT|nr:hypothetical protein [Telmatocola sphagniphila]QVL34784.1 hypothetical protein KIH39_13005 [Telmatocola sphagniphila]
MNSSKSTINRSMHLCLLGLLIFVPSCGNSNNLYPVTGKVIYKGQPAVGAILYFNVKGADPKVSQTASAVVGEDGTYTLETSRFGKGAAPGDYTVIVYWPREDTEAKGHHTPAAPKKGNQPDRLKQKYFVAGNPLLEAKIIAGKNEIPPFDLTD